MRIAVVGGFNLDLVTHVARRPERGEALAAESFAMHPGGKGFNQAVAAARLGAEVAIVGCVGDDPFASPFFEAMATEGIDATHVVRHGVEGTGIGMPVVFPDGSNSIIYAPRANLALRPEDVRAGADAIAGADMLLIQLEVPMAANLEAVRIAEEAGVLILLNPAPAADLPGGLLERVAIVAPNEGEAAMIAHDALPAPEEQARHLYQPGMLAAVVTLGERGAAVATADETFSVRAFGVEAVDTVGAGDAFCGAMAVGTLRGLDIRETVRFACASGALTVTREGASTALPSLREVEALLSASGAGGSAA